MASAEQTTQSHCHHRCWARAGLLLVAIAVGNAADWAPSAGAASAIALVPTWLVLMVRAGRSRVAVSKDGIEVRRVFVTRTIAREDYDGVTYPPAC